MAYTARDLITDSLMEIGVLADGETPTASQARGGLRKLNNLIDSWNINSLLTYGSNSYTIPLQAGKGVYTIGVGGDLNVPRPAIIQSAYIRDMSAAPETRTDYPLVLYTNEEWQNVWQKEMTAAWPNWGVWFDDSYPLINMYTNPVPSSSQYAIVFWAQTNIGNYGLDDEISLAPGYLRAFTLNLALELAPSYGPSAIEQAGYIQQEAKLAKGALAVKNIQLNPLSMDYRLQRRGLNIITFRTGDF